MKTYPKAQILLTQAGVERIRVLYLPGQRPDAWELCQKLLPRLRMLESDHNEPVEPRS